MEDRIPTRKSSSASSASSGRTIKPSSRQASTNGGFFARFRSASPQRRSEDGHDNGDDTDGLDGDSETEAGPSDYYRRSPSPQSPPSGWRTASSDIGDHDDMNMDGPRDEWTAANVWVDSDPGTPRNGPAAEEVEDEEVMEGDDSMSVDMIEYQKRIRQVLNGSRSPRQDSEETEEEGIGVEPGVELSGNGEEEFGMQSPRSSAPSTPSKMPRQISYIRQ